MAFRNFACSSHLECPFAWTSSVRFYTVFILMMLMTLILIILIILIITITMLIKVSRLVPESGGSLGLGAKAEPGEKKVEKQIHQIHNT